MFEWFLKLQRLCLIICLCVQNFYHGCVSTYNTVIKSKISFPHNIISNKLTTTYQNQNMCKFICYLYCVHFREIDRSNFHSKKSKFMIGKFYKLQKTYSKKITPKKSIVVRMHFFGQMSD